MTQAEIEEILSRAGAQKVKKAGRFLTACCPFHGEKTPSFKVKIGSNKWKCYGCGKFGTMEWLLVDLGLAEKPDGELPQDVRLERAQWGQRPLQPEPKVEVKDWPEEALAPFRGRVPRYAVDLVEAGGRGLTLETCRRWELGMDKEAGRLIFPLRDRRGKLVGMSGRSYRGSRIKYTHYCYDILEKRAVPFIGERKEGTYLESKKSEILYGAWLEPSKGSDNVLIVVEGHLDVIRMDQAGFWCVGILGSSPGDVQIQTLVEMVHGAGARVVVMLDGDTAGQRGTQKFRPLARRVPLWRAYLFEDEDPGSMSLEDLEAAIEEAEVM